MLKATSSVRSILFMGFNQTRSCLCVGTSSGFQIWDIVPAFKLRYRRDLQGGVGLVHILFRTNLVALVGGGENPAFPPNQVVIWDEMTGAAIAHLEFPIEVRSVKLLRDRIVVAVDGKVYVYRFEDLALMYTVFTVNNPRGLLDVSENVLVFPGAKTGYVYVRNRNRGKPLHAHANGIQCMALNADGSLLATASVMGTLVRVWDTSSLVKVAELRRGKDSAQILSISFSLDSKMLSVSSDHRTIHVFHLPVPTKEGEEEDEKKKKKKKEEEEAPLEPTYGSLLWNYLWPASAVVQDAGVTAVSFAQLRGGPERALCCFGSSNSSKPAKEKGCSCSSKEDEEEEEEEVWAIGDDGKAHLYTLKKNKPVSHVINDFILKKSPSP